MQRTLARSLAFAGVGLHGGRPVRMTLRPAPAGTGIAFLRVDVTERDPLVPARWDRVVDTRLCTVIGNAAGVTVSTVEHVMAALAGCGVDDALIDIDGPEVPIMDGSAQPFVDALLAGGLVAAPFPQRAIRILGPVTVERGDARATLLPAEPGQDGLRLELSIAFDDAAIGRQSFAMDLTPAGFIEAVADCRTFARLAEIESLRAAGLAQGGGLHNAVVVDGARVLNRGGLRRPDEFVRHKTLDAVGDLALAGAPIIGRYVGVKAGHALTNQVLQALFARPDAWRWEPASPRTLPAPLDLPRGPERIAAE